MAREKGFWAKLLGLSGRSVIGAYPPLGLLALSAWLKQHGFEVVVIDGFRSTTASMLKRLRHEPCDLIGISSYTMGWERDKLFIRQLKEYFPHIPVVLGGPHPTGWTTNTLRDCPDLDFAVAGDGEYPLLSLCQALAHQAPPPLVDGLLIRNASGGVNWNGRKAQVADLALLPRPDRTALPISEYIPTLTNYRRLPATYLLASRGCPFHCIFCHTSRHVRYQPVERVLDELTELVETYGIREVMFYDETFTLQESRVLELCEGMRQRRLNLSWAANARAGSVSEPMLRAMKGAGCWRLLFGIESGVDRVLQLMKKGITRTAIESSLRLTRRVGIETHGTFMFGTPGETWADGLATIDFACSLPLDYAAFGALAPIPGSEVYDQLVSVDPGEFPNYSMVDIAYVPESMSREELASLLRLAWQRFYWRPSYIARRIMKLRSLEDLRRHLVGFLGLAAYTVRRR
jgi:radical SAM superfamily enzyme YgiQ (UPF0313 family)